MMASFAAVLIGRIGHAEGASAWEKDEQKDFGRCAGSGHKPTGNFARRVERKPEPRRR
jgi:hypothetical protein